MSAAAHPSETGILSRPRRLALGAWFLLTLGLGTFGYLRYEAAAGSEVSLLTALYHSVQLFVLHAPHFEHHVNWALEIARWSAAVLLGGTVYQVARQVFRGEFAALRRRALSGHVVVAGLGQRALQCVRSERSKPRRVRRDVMVIDRAPRPDLASACSKLGADLVVGDVNDASTLRSAGVLRATELWALCPDDSVNCEIAVQATRLLSESPRNRAPLQCNVHLSDIDLRMALQQHATPAAQGAPLSLRFFDLFDFEARRVLLTELPIDHDGISAEEPRQPHLVILGFGRMGRSIALRAAKLGHFANRVRDPRLQLRISVIDRAADAREAALLFRYPHFREACELSVHQLDIETPAARELLERWCTDAQSLTSLVVAFDDDARAAEVTLRLLPLLQSNDTRVAVRLANRNGLAGLLEQVWTDTAGRPRVRSYGHLDEGCCESALSETANERLARAIHHNFVADRKQQHERAENDQSVLAWPQLPEDLRESNRQQADHIPIKLRAIGCAMVPESDARAAVQTFVDSEIELLARMEHERWRAERWLAGWTPGSKDIARRTTPFLTGWDELPADVQDYDRAAVRNIPALLRGVGMKVCRR